MNVPTTLLGVVDAATGGKTGVNFRQSTYRAVRQGLMKAECVLLEPMYDFRLEIPLENL